MVRVNLLNPNCLADQHLIAEYDEILMLLGYVKRYPQVKSGEIPKNYKLGTGHIRFFKDKLLYLQKRHELLKREMVKRSFKPNITIDLKEFPKELINDWKPTEKDFKIIKERIIQKIEKKPDYYRHYGEYKHKEVLIKLIKQG